MAARSSHYIPTCFLVGHRACSAARRNATTAWSKTSTGLPIAVTFCAARPPMLSHFFVNCPGIESSDVSLSPEVITEDVNLVVLRVPLDSRSRIHNRYSDYFVYRVDPRRPSLHLLPNPYPETFGDNEIAILSCNNGDDFVVAALRIVPSIKPTFKLHLYRSTNGNQGMWNCQLLSVEKPLRDMHVYHVSTKVIILGGDKGIVGWVDLWRSILLCNVLSLNPNLLDIPLPSPAVGNLENYLNRCPTYFRDITVNKTKDTIKYVEMEITPPEEMFAVPPGTDPNWMFYHQCLPQHIIPGSWTTTAYKMPMGVGSVHKWKKVATVHLRDLDTSVGYQRVHKLMDMLLRTSDNKKAPESTEATLPLGCLCMAYPTLSIDDDVVYFLAKGTGIGSRGSMRGLVTVDMMQKTLEGVELLDTRRHMVFMPAFFASEISNYRKTAGTKREALGCAEEDISEANKTMSND